MILAAGYCRVSTDRGEQQNSYAAQQRFFREYIEHRPDLELYGIYADEGLSGTSTRRRVQFHRMIADARAGKFQLILTKEVSRFSRNILDTIRYTRELRQCGVGVFFLNDNIHTLDPDAELRLSIMASIAQEESRRTSERIRWGQTRQMERGVVFGHSLLGYTVQNGTISVEPDGAEIVRQIFHKYGVEKKGTAAIAGELRKKYPEKAEWSGSHILKILKNEKYAGDLIQKKTITPDYLTHEKKQNHGEEELIVLRDHHEAIISRELWETVQKELAERAKTPQSSGGSVMLPFSGKIRCGECGAVFIARIKYRKDGSFYRRWRCTGNCGIGHLLRDDTASEMIRLLLSSLPMNRARIADEVTALAAEVLPDADAETIAGIRRTVRMLLDGSLPGEALNRILTERVTVFKDHTAEIRLTGLSAVFRVGE